MFRSRTGKSQNSAAPEQSCAIDRSAPRIGGWIQTYTGKQMFPLDPREDELEIRDIAHALSNMCRFNGHVSRFYSVAEHACHVHDVVSKSLRRTALLHDASEAYLCDVPRPIKRSQGFAEKYLAAEHRLMKVIADRFHMAWPMPDEIHHADNRLLATEAAQLMAPLHPEWADHYPIVEGLVLPCWSPEQARNEFLRRFHGFTMEAD